MIANTKSKLMVLFCFFIYGASAQIEVKPFGDALFGNPWGPNDPNNEVSIECFGINTNAYRPGAKISFGDYGSSTNYSCNVFIGELGNTDSDALQLNGNSGIYLTTGGNGTYEVAKFLPNGNLELRGSLFSQSPNLSSSDTRLKKNMRTLTGALDIVKKLTGISYDWKTDKDSSLLVELRNTRTIDDKAAKNLEKQKKEVETRMSESTNQLGFAAQDVQAVLPQLVKTDSKGYLAVNYVGIVPVLVEAIKDQQKQIDDLKKQIDELRALIRR